MTGEKAHAHETSLSMIKPALAEVIADTDMALKVAVSCSSACDLRGKLVKIVGEDAAVVHEIELTEFDGTSNETAEFVVRAPTKLGECVWTVEFSEQEEEGSVHGKSSVPVSFVVKPHPTNIAVWDVPSPIAFGETFKIKVGVKCSLGCELTDKPIEIYNHEGTKIATGTVGDVPWSNEAALSCAEVELKAPGEEETRYRWTAKLPEPDLEVPHAEASSAFAFGTARKADHVVTIEVIDNETKTPIHNAHVVLRPAIYRGNSYWSHSDESGVARVSVPQNKYHLSVTKDEYKTFTWIAEVVSDTVIKAEVIAGSDLDEFIT